jgi:hypothetical protein
MASAGRSSIPISLKTRWVLPVQPGTGRQSQQSVRLQEKQDKETIFWYKAINYHNFTKPICKSFTFAFYLVGFIDKGGCNSD